MTRSPWSALAREDIQAAYRYIKDNHPGPVDIENPAFGEWLEMGRRLALEKAEQAVGFEGYEFALRSFINGFKDGHLGCDFTLSRKNVEWPGFVPALRGERFVVHALSDDRKAFPHLPVKGDRLVSCDGRTPEDILKQDVFPYKGNEALAASWIGRAPRLLLDQGNPFVRRPKSCRFDSVGGERTLPLDWKRTERDRIEGLLSAASFGAVPAIGMRRFLRKGYWVSLPSFWVEGDDRIRLQELVREIAQARASEPLVLDVRGNSGGSSQWGKSLLENLLGKERVDAVSGHLEVDERVDWRVSQGNLEHLRELKPYLLEQFGRDSEVYGLWGGVEKGMALALEKGEVLYREPHLRKTTGSRAEPAVKRVFLLTDGRCASACLDFIDLLKATAQVVHVGQPTSADTNYMEVRRPFVLPSGIARLHVATKVYRNRARKANASYVPDHPWEGDVADTEALERWLAELAARSSR